MSIAKALLDFQKAAPDLHRDSENPHFRSKFLSLEGLFGKVLPVANANGLVIQQWVTTLEGQPALTTRITHAESGESISDTMLLHAKPDPQSQGSAITYARRYSLMAALGLVADEDDDGAGSGGNGGTPARTDLPAIPEDAKPSEYVIHFGKNRGTLLGSLTKQQLGWYAEKWEVQENPSDYDRRLKGAAFALYAGDDTPLTSVPAELADVPF